MSKSKDATDLKKAKLQEIAQHLAKRFANDEKVYFNKFLDWCEYTLGLTRGKAGDYVRLVCRVHNWNITAGEIPLIDKEGP